MKKSLMIVAALAAMSAGITGCTSTSAEWGGERVVTGADGLPLVSHDGTVQKVKEPIRLSSWRHWMDTYVNTAKLDVEKDRLLFAMNGYRAEPSEELNKLVDTSLKGAAELATRIGAAIATAGGTACADSVSGLIQRFVSKGGDASKATVTCKDGSCTVTDGTVTCSGDKCWE